MISGVSDELPLYFKSKYTVLNPPNPQKKQLKPIKAMLKQGVSSDSPLFFQLNHVAVVDSQIRNQQISGKDQNPGRFLSSLKQNILSTRPAFDYSDSQLCNFDYHNLKPSKIIDLAADKSPRIKEQTRFHLEFSTHLQKGFGRSRGQCTLEAMQPKIPRYQLGQIEVLQNKLSMSARHEHKIRLNTGKGSFNHTQTTFPSVSPFRNSGVKFSQRRTSTPMTLFEIDEFEKKNRINNSPLESRQIYSMD